MDFAKIFTVANGQQVLLYKDIEKLDANRRGQAQIIEITRIPVEGDLLIIGILTHGVRTHQMADDLFDFYDQSCAQRFYDFIKTRPPDTEINKYDHLLKDAVKNLN